MELTIDLSQKSKHTILKLAKHIPEELLKLPEDFLTKNDWEHWDGQSTLLHYIAKTGCVELLNYPDYLYIKNSKNVSVAYYLGRYLEKKEDIKKLVDIIGFDKLHEITKDKRNLLHELADKGYVDILHHPNSFKDEDGCYRFPVSYLLEEADKKDLDTILNHPLMLCDLKPDPHVEKPKAKKVARHLFNSHGYPLYYLSRNRQCNPTIKELKKYFTFKTHYRGNKKFDAAVLQDIVESNPPVTNTMQFLCGL